MYWATLAPLAEFLERQIKHARNKPFDKQGDKVNNWKDQTTTEDFADTVKNT